MPWPGASSPLGLTKWLAVRPMLCGLLVHLPDEPVARDDPLRQRLGRVVARVEKQSVEQLRAPSSARPGDRPMTLGLIWVAALVTWTTRSSEPASSTATIAVMSLVRLAGARDVSGSRCPQDEPRVDVDEVGGLAVDRQVRLRVRGQPQVREVEVVEVGRRRRGLRDSGRTRRPAALGRRRSCSSAAAATTRAMARRKANGRGGAAGVRAYVGCRLVERRLRRWEPPIELADCSEGLRFSASPIPGSPGTSAQWGDCALLRGVFGGVFRGSPAALGSAMVVGSLRRVASWSLAASIVVSAVAESFAFMNTGWP